MPLFETDELEVNDMLDSVMLADGPKDHKHCLLYTSDAADE